MLFRSRSRRCLAAGIAFLAAALVCSAQQPQRHPARVPHRHAHARATKTAPKPAGQMGATATPGPQPQTPPRPVDQPAQPATITLADGKLVVKADNSSLNDIVDQLGKSGGMTVSGLSKDQRVFGEYGPGDPRQILTELLEGAGYNVMMLGVTQQGTPRELMLSERGSAPAASPQSFPQDATPPPMYQRQPVPPEPGNLNFPMRTPAQSYEQMMQQRQQQNQQPQPPQQPQ